VDIYRIQSSSLRTGVKEIVTRTPYRYAVGLMIKTDEVSEQVWLRTQLDGDSALVCPRIVSTDVDV
jgi:hypothetical protein